MNVTLCVWHTRRAPLQMVVVGVVCVCVMSHVTCHIRLPFESVGCASANCAFGHLRCPEQMRLKKLRRENEGVETGLVDEASLGFHRGGTESVRPFVLFIDDGYAFSGLAYPRIVATSFPTYHDSPFSSVIPYAQN